MVKTLGFRSRGLGDQVLTAEEVVHASYDVLHVLRNAIIPCKRIGLIFNLVEPGRALMKFIANLSDACTTSSVLTGCGFGFLSRKKSVNEFKLTGQQCTHKYTQKTTLCYLILI